MKTTNDLPLDPLGSLGAPIRPTPAAPAPRPTDNPEVLRNADGSLQTNVAPPVAPPAPVWHPLPAVVIDDGQAEDWEGLV